MDKIDHNTNKGRGVNSVLSALFVSILGLATMLSIGFPTVDNSFEQQYSRTEIGDQCPSAPSCDGINLQECCARFSEAFSGCSMTVDQIDADLVLLNDACVKSSQ